MGSLSITLNLPHLYLEMARAVFTGIYPRGEKPEEELATESGISSVGGVIFTATSATIIYSYLSIEAFVNYHLYEIWEHSRTAHEAIENLKEENPKAAKNVIPLYDTFYQKYGHYDEFEKLKSTDLGELGKRVNVLCEAIEIRKIHDADPELWQSFQKLLRRVRHFLIHPFPDPTRFHDMMRKILIETKLGEYPEIAQRMIQHFYEEKGESAPGWVGGNTLFRFKGIEYLR